MFLKRFFFPFFFLARSFFFVSSFSFLFLCAMASPKSLIFGNVFFFQLLKSFLFYLKIQLYFFFLFSFFADSCFLFLLNCEVFFFFFGKCISFFVAFKKRFFLYDHVGKYTSFFLFKNTILLVKPIITEVLLKELKQLVFCCQF